MLNLPSDIKYRAYIGELADDPGLALQAGLEFIHWDKYVNKKSKVFVKPNFTFPYYKEGVTTNPEFLKRLLELLKSKADTVIVGESDGGNHSFTAEDAFQGHNMYQICKETGAELVSLSTLPAETIESEVLGKKIRVQLPKLLLEEIDCFISVPVLKIHVATTVSLSLKNSWGCVPDMMRCLQHQNLIYKLALIAKLLKPKIVVIDGTYALNRHGPMYGDAVRTDLVLVADNTVAADALGARILGFSPQEVKSIAVAERAGLGSTRLEDVETNRDWRDYKRQFQIEQTLIDRGYSLLFYSDTLARLVMASPLTPAIRKVAGIFRTSAEKELASQLGKQKTLGPY
ncbi:DUF362 domain-containing protein [Chloroflexota bacterium]